MGMRFIINGLKYETDKMEEIATVKKWYRITNAPEFPAGSESEDKE